MITFFVLFLGLFYYFRDEEVVRPDIDSIKVKMSAQKRMPTEVKLAVVKIPKEIIEETPPAAIPEEDEEQFVSSTEEEQLEHIEEIPWDEIKTGWKDNLKDFLLELDPDQGEAIYNAYLEENDNFEKEIENLTKNGSENGINKQDLDNLLGQIDARHEDKLKEILGPHYYQVTEQHQHYNSSLQYLNHSDNFEVGVSL